MKRDLIICTASFPYGYGETFLETEILFLSKFFNRIFILPDNRLSDKKRTIPTNVEVISNQQGKISLIHTLAFAISEPLIRKEFIHNTFSHPARNKVLLKSLQLGLQKKIAIENIIREKEIQKVVLYSYWLDPSAIGIALYTGKCRKISRTHSWDLYETRQKYNYLPLRPFLLKSLNTIFSISQDGVSHIQNKYKNSANTLLSRLGVLPGISEPTSKAAFTKMLSISSMIPIKRINAIKNCFDKFPNLFQNIAWEHYGTGPLYNELKKENPEVFKGQISNKEIRTMLNANKDFSFLINVSQYEGIPVSMMEAMSYGIPCIGTNVGGVSEIIEDGYNGYLLSPNPDSKEITNTLKKIMSLTPAQSLEMRIAAFNTWKSKFCAEKNYTAFAKSIST